MSCIGDKAGEVSMYSASRQFTASVSGCRLAVCLSPACLYLCFSVYLSFFLPDCLPFSPSVCRPDKTCCKLFKWRHKLVENKCQNKSQINKFIEIFVPNIFK